MNFLAEPETSGNIKLIGLTTVQSTVKIKGMQQAQSNHWVKSLHSLLLQLLC